jgi:hypothetical protein
MVTSLDPTVPFSECCETISVNAHGCGLIASRALPRGTPVKLDMLPETKQATARIVDVVPLGEDQNSWLIGTALDVPGNIWGLKRPPANWETLSTSETNPREQSGRVPTRTMAAGVGSGGVFMMASITHSANAESTTIADPLEQKQPAAFPADSSWDEPSTSSPVGGGENETGPEPVPFDVDSRAQAKAFLAEVEAKRASRQGPQGEAVSSGDAQGEEVHQKIRTYVEDMVWQVEERMDAALERWRQEHASSEAKLDRLAQSLFQVEEQVRRLSGETRPEPASADQGHPSQAAHDLESLRRECRAELQAAQQQREKIELLLACIPQTLAQHTATAGPAHYETPDYSLIGPDVVIQDVQKLLETLHKRLQDAHDSEAAAKREIEEARRWITRELETVVSRMKAEQRR